MAHQAHQSDDSVLIGPIGVRADAAEAAEFAAALRLAIPPGSVPLTFPMRWLALAPVREAMESLIGAHPVHASQTFNFADRIKADCDYTLHIDIRQQHAPSRRLVVRSSVTNQDDRAVVQFETVLLPTAAISAAPIPNEYEAGSGFLPDIDVGPIEEAQAARYAAAAHDDGRLHCDPDFARSIGLDGPIVHGMLMMGLFQKALSEWQVGSHISRLFALFARPVPIGSRLVISGRIVSPSKAKGAERQIVRLFVRTERNQIACIGEATVVPASTVPP
jgi:acyl dehydratase